MISYSNFVYNYNQATVRGVFDSESINILIEFDMYSIIIFYHIYQWVKIQVEEKGWDTMKAWIAVWMYMVYKLSHLSDATVEHFQLF